MRFTNREIHARIPHEGRLLPVTIPKNSPVTRMRCAPRRADDGEPHYWLQPTVFPEGSIARIHAERDGFRIPVSATTED